MQACRGNSEQLPAKRAFRLLSVGLLTGRTLELAQLGSVLF